LPVRLCESAIGPTGHLFGGARTVMICRGALAHSMALGSSTHNASTTNGILPIFVKPNEAKICAHRWRMPE
jgi:hypothetical protein